MSIENHFSTNELTSIQGTKLFDGLSADFFGKFVRLASRKQYEGHSRVHLIGEAGNSLFTVIIDGCVAVWDDSYGDDTIDALLTKGQIFGEFDFLKYRTPNIALVSLTETVTARVDCSQLHDLLKSESEPGKSLFFENLATTLVEKLIAQNTLLKFRTGDYPTRLAKFLDNFGKPGWLYLTSQDPDYVRRRFTINIFFNKEDLRGIIEGEWRSIGPAISKMIEKHLLSFNKYDQNLNNLGEASHTEFSKNKFPDCRYVTISVVDSDLLSEVSLGLEPTRSRA